jgi:hypothetical protein
MKKSLALSVAVILMGNNAFAFPPNLAQLGTGFDSLSKTEKGRCVEITATNQRPLGQEVNYMMEHITSVNQLKRELGIQAEASFGFGVFSGNCKVDYANSEDFNSYSTFMTVKIEVKNQTESLNQYRLRDWAYDLLANEGGQAFFHRCGDQFVAGQTTGGEFIAVVKFSAKNNEERESIKRSIAASNAHFKASGNFSEEIKKIAKKTEHSIRIFKKGACGGLPNLDQLMDSIHQFPAEVDPVQNGRPWIIDAVTTTYNHVENLPSGNANLMDVDHQRNFLSDLAQTRDNAIFLRNNIKRLLENSSQFEPFDRNQWTEYFQSINNIIDRTRDKAQSCISNPQENCRFENDAILIPCLVLPAEKVKQVDTPIVTIPQMSSEETIIRHIFDTHWPRTEFPERREGSIQAAIDLFKQDRNLAEAEHRAKTWRWLQQCGDQMICSIQ